MCIQYCTMYMHLCNREIGLTLRLVKDSLTVYTLQFVEYRECVQYTVVLSSTTVVDRLTLLPV
jgi:hypothetical protein